MKAVFKKMLAIGGSMALAGVILSVIGLFFSDGMPKTYFSPREILPSWIANEFFDDWDEHLPVVMEGSANGQQFSVDFLNELELDCRGCSVEIVVGKEGQTSATLEMKGQLTQQHIDQKYNSNKGKWELELNSRNENQYDSYQAVLTVPPTLSKMDIKAKMGKVSIGSIHLNELDLETNMGNIELDNVSAAISSMNTDMGNIEGSVALTGKQEIDCSMGNIELRINAQGEYGYKMENKMGSVTIGNTNYSSIDKKMEVNSNAPLFFDVECSMGNVTLAIV